jgi:hypothetical protein
MIKILMQNNIRINKVACAVSEFLMTSDIFSNKILSFGVYLSFSPEKIMKQIRLKDLILFLFSVEAEVKIEPDKVTLSKYKMNRS